MGRDMGDPALTGYRIPYAAAWRGRIVNEEAKQGVAITLSVFLTASFFPKFRSLRSIPNGN